MLRENKGFKSAIQIEDIAMP